MALAFCQCIQAQVLWNSNGQYRLEPHNPPQSFAIGPNFTSGYALDVHGEQMNPPLGNVFKTDAPGHTDTYWRMFHQGMEFGNLFHLDQSKDFNVNATSGYLRFHTNTIDRMRLTPTLTGQTVNGYTGLDLSGHLGIGGPFSVPPLSYSHIDKNGSLFAGYRDWMVLGTYISENSDGMYVGTKNGGTDRIDAVINGDYILA
jgi:hypothetical protein